MSRPGSFTNEQVQDMRKLYWVDCVTASSIIEKYNRPRSTIRNVLYYENYSNVPDVFDYSEIRRKED